MNHKQLVQHMNEMQLQMEKYQAELSSLRTQLASYENVETPIATTNATTSRRKLLKRLGIAGIAGVGAITMAAAVNPNYTVLAAPNPDNAIEANGGPTGYGLQATGGAAALFLAPAALGTGAHQVGEITVDANGNLLYCITAGTGSAAVWRRLSGTGASGAFFGIAPVRVYESRTGSTSHSFTGNKPVQVTGVAGIPSGATAVTGIVAAVSSGFNSSQPFPSYGQIAVSANGASNFTTVSFSSPLITATSQFTSNLDNTGKLIASVYTPGYTVDMSIDIVGYYL